MSNNSLPIGFEKLRTEKPYVNLSKLAEGVHKFRIVQRPIAGWIDWKDKKPYRYRPDSKPATSFDPLHPMKAFWALHVWDYAKEGLYIMEITQSTIRKSLETYAMNEEWGDLTSYDIKIEKEGSGKDTNYTVIPVPPKPMNKKIQEAVISTKIRLEALYEGKDPWTDLIDTETGEIHVNRLSADQESQLASLSSQINDEKYLQSLANFLNVDQVTDIEPAHFDRAIRSLEKKIKENGGNHERSVA
jgi:hypothetical protein